MSGKPNARPAPNSTAALTEMLRADMATLLAMLLTWEQHQRRVVAALSATLESEGAADLPSRLDEAITSNLTDQLSRMHQATQSAYCSAVAAATSVEDAAAVIGRIRRRRGAAPLRSYPLGGAR